MFMLLSVSETLVKQSETSETFSNNQHFNKKKLPQTNIHGSLHKIIMGDNILCLKRF